MLVLTETAAAAVQIVLKVVPSAVVAAAVAVVEKVVVWLVAATATAVATMVVFVVVVDFLWKDPSFSSFSRWLLLLLLPFSF